MNYYPAFLDLRDKKVVVLGGGKVAERKVASLLDSGAIVTVISPALTRRLLKEKDRKAITHTARKFQKADLKDAFLVIAATDSPEINKQAALNSPGLVNVADVPSLCNFIAPSVVKRGSLVIAISTGGASPALAKTVRKELEKNYGSEFSAYLRLAKEMRQKAMVAIKERKRRERLLKFLGSEEVLGILRSGGIGPVKELVLKRFGALNKGRAESRRSKKQNENLS